MYNGYTVAMEVNSMILKSNIVTNLEINSLEDLYKLKPFIENSSLNINKSQIAREFGVDRRTVDKYINGFHKSKKRKKGSLAKRFKDFCAALRVELPEIRMPVFWVKMWEWVSSK